MRYDGPVYFANVDSFQKTVYRLSGLNPAEAGRDLQKQLRALKKKQKDKKKASKKTRTLNGVNNADNDNDTATGSNDLVEIEDNTQVSFVRTYFT